MFIEHMGSKIVLRIDDPAVTQVLNLLLMLTACPYEERTVRNIFYWLPFLTATRTDSAKGDRRMVHFTRRV